MADWPRTSPDALLDEPFNTNLSAWTLDVNGAQLSVSNGRLVPSATGEKTLRRTDKPFTDGKVCVKFHLGPTTAGFQIDTILRSVDYNNLIAATLFVSGGNFLWQGTLRSGGAESAALGSALSGVSPVANTDYWAVFRLLGNALVMALYTGNPATSAPISTRAWDLTSVGAYNAGHSGSAGVRMFPADTSFYIEDFIVVSDFRAPPGQNPRYAFSA